MNLLIESVSVLRRRTATTNLVISLFCTGCIVLFSTLAHLLTTKPVQAISTLKERNGSMSNNYSNNTNSLQVDKLVTNEYGREFKDKTAERTHIIKFRDYIFTLKNLSAKPIDAIILSSKQGDQLKSTVVRFYRYTEQRFAPQAVIKYTIPGIAIDQTLSIEAIIFDDNTYEGNARLAMDALERWEGARLKLLELQPLLSELNQTEGTSFSASLARFTQQLQQEKNTPFAFNLDSSEEERKLTNIRLGAIDMVEYMLHKLNPDMEYSRQKAVTQALNKWANEMITRLGLGK